MGFFDFFSRNKYEQLRDDVNKTLLNHSEDDDESEELDIKVQAAIETIVTTSPKKVEAAARAAIEIYAQKKISDTDYDVLAKLGSQTEIYAKFSAEYQGILNGIAVLAEAGIVHEDTLEVSGEYRTKYAKLSAQLKAYARLDATAKADITFFNLKNLELINATVSAKASAYAEAKLSGSIQVYIIDNFLTANADAEVKAYAKAEAEASGTLVISAEKIELSGKLSALAEVGVGATAGLSLKNESGESLISLTVEGKFVSGVGGELSGGFVLENGKLKLSVGVGAAVGGGLDGNVAVEVNYGLIGAAVKDGVITAYKALYGIDQGYQLLGPENEPIEGEDLARLLAYYETFFTQNRSKLTNQELMQKGIRAAAKNATAKNTTAAVAYQLGLLYKDQESEYTKDIEVTIIAAFHVVFGTKSTLILQGLTVRGFQIK